MGWVRNNRRSILWRGLIFTKIICLLKILYNQNKKKNPSICWSHLVSLDKTPPRRCLLVKNKPRQAIQRLGARDGSWLTASVTTRAGHKEHFNRTCNEGNYYTKPYELWRRNSGEGGAVATITGKLPMEITEFPGFGYTGVSVKNNEKSLKTASERSQ